MSAAAVWVFHRGALGDSVLLWPMLRALRRAGRRVVLVTDGSKGRLAAAELGIEAVSAEQPRFNGLWREDAPPDRVRGVGEVIAFAPNDSQSQDSLWERNLRLMFPGTELRVLRSRPDAPLAREWSERGGGAEPRDNPRGEIVVHVGAGAEAKRWPLERFLRVTSELATAPIAGEVERDRFSPRERALFRDGNGSFVDSLEELGNRLTRARLVIAGDSGPAHLAAQLGVPTLSLFGPGDPRQWGPVGPRVRVLAPPAPSPMDWLSVDRVASEALALLAPP